MERISKVTLISLIFVVLSVPLSGCGSKQAETTKTQVATVQRGDLTLEITASGNLSFSTSRDLNFGMAGTVAEVNVKAGDTVTKGQVLANLDTTTLEQAVDAAQLAVQSAEIDIEAAKP